jgi:hypothetical protein
MAGVDGRGKLAVAGRVEQGRCARGGTGAMRAVELVWRRLHSGACLEPKEELQGRAPAAQREEGGKMGRWDEVLGRWLGFSGQVVGCLQLTGVNSIHGGNMSYS